MLIHMWPLNVTAVSTPVSAMLVPSFSKQIRKEYLINIFSVSSLSFDLPLSVLPEVCQRQDKRLHRHHRLEICAVNFNNLICSPYK